MLERYMDEETKALILARITINDEIGLSYQQNGALHRSPHFDFTPLIEAYQRYLDGFGAWFAASHWRAIDAAWLAVGLAQRDVPVHVAQEYCRPDRSFYPCPEFNEVSLPRVLSFYYFGNVRTWFPAERLGADGAETWAARRGRGAHAGVDGRYMALAVVSLAQIDLAAMTRLDEVRTDQLTQSREYLQSPATSHRFSS
jgi:hypothetical protein